MESTMIVLEKVREETVKWVGDRPLTFAEWLEAAGRREEVELVDGVLVERTAAPLYHEELRHWLSSVLGIYAEERELGIVLGPRTAVEIHQFRGRLPDLLFATRSREQIVQQQAHFGGPDLVLEIISPDDRPSDAIAREVDYRSVGVREIVFIDQPKGRARLLRRQENGYAEEVLPAGALVLETLGSLRFEPEWLSSPPHPGIRATVDALLAAGGAR
jgi:Uma2 family endonuclease